MKKTSFLVVSIMLALSMFLTACGGNDNENAANNSNKEANEQAAAEETAKPSAAPSAEPAAASVKEEFGGLGQKAIPANWADGGDAVYTLTPDGQHNGEDVLKVDFDKKGKEWAYMVTPIDDASLLSGINSLTLSVFGNANLLLKLEGAGGAVEQPFELTGGENWQVVTWDLSTAKDVLSGANKMLIFAAPGNNAEKGSFKIRAPKVTGKGWADNGDGVYNLSLDADKGLKADYKKGDFDWAFMYMNHDTNVTFKKATSLTATIIGNVKILVKLEKPSGPQETTFEFTGGDTPQPLNWDISTIDISDLQRVLIFAAPGTKSEEGSFFIKDFAISGE